MGLFMLFNYDIDEIRKLKLVAEVKGRQVWQLFVVAIVAHLIFSYFISIYTWLLRFSRRKGLYHATPVLPYPKDHFKYSPSTTSKRVLETYSNYKA